MANPIVNATVSITAAPRPNTLQKTGALLSQGGTTLATGTYALITQPADLTPLQAAPLAVTSIAWAGGTATVTTAAAHDVTSGDHFWTTIAGATTTIYNGLVLATATGASTFTYALVSDGGTTPATGTITYTPRNSGELLQMVTTFYAQGANQSVYVLELGAGEAAAGVTELTTLITNKSWSPAPGQAALSNPQGRFYAYLVPRSWDGVSGFLTLLTSLDGPFAATYFYITTTTGTITDYTAILKSAYLLVEAPGATALEFQAAGPFWDLLNTNPSATNKVAPFEYRFQFGVTPWPSTGQSSTLATIAAENGNYVGTGQQAGISTALIFGGQYADGNPVNYWYSIDWAVINGTQNVGAAVINGSNNPINPLYYNQPGINSLQQVLASTMTSASTFGMLLNPVVQTELDGPALDQALDNGIYDGYTVVNAIPFPAYSVENPDDYGVGVYSGLSVSQYTPLRGFDKIDFNINVTNFGG
jgi:hypothetical protein